MKLLQNYIMNIYTSIIFAALLINFCLNVLSEFLNLRSLTPELPAEFADTYDPKAYDKSQRYTRSRTRFGFVVETFDLAILLLFWFSGAFNLFRSAGTVRAGGKNDEQNSLQ